MPAICQQNTRIACAEHEPPTRVWQTCLALFGCFFASLFLASIFTGLANAETQTGLFRGKQITYQMLDGLPVYQGDILLDQVQTIKPGAGLIQPFSLGVSYPSYLWPKVGGVYQVPYVISSGTPNLNTAIAQFNTTFGGLIQFVPRAAQADFVNINLDLANFNRICRSNVGRIGGEQTLDGSGSCDVGTLLHEMGHTVGLYHEQSRADRDSFLNVLYGNIIKDSRINFDPEPENAQNLTLFDYASVMMYIPFAFSRNGGPTLESIPPGMPLSNRVGYTTTDIDAIRRLYATPPQQVTIDSNPSGLQVLVDGVTVTTPQTFNWALNSTHTLAIPAGSQTLDGTSYTYGRWNDNPAASHSITVLRGNGLRAQPVATPAVTVYTANFIQLVSYTQAVTGSGSMTASPPPQSYPPAAGQFYVARQSVTLQATPNPGNNFYAFFNSPFFLPGGISANPKIFLVPDDGNLVNVTAAFTTAPVVTILTNPSGLGLFVDGGFWFAPKIFAPPYDPAWTLGSAHLIDSYTPQLPFSINTRYLFNNWSDGDTLAHNIAAPATNTTFTANFTPQYLLARYATPACAGSVNVSPASPTADGFYAHNTAVNVGQTPSSGWVFTGWRFDLSGLASPQSLNVNDEELVVADYNTVSTPLAISSLSPASAVAGGTGFTLFINGTGFTSNTIVFVNNVFRSSVFVNATQIAVTISAADISTPGAFSVVVENFPAGAVCGVFAARSFSVATSPLLRATPAALSFGGQALNTISVARGVSVTNTSNAPVSIASVQASGNFSTFNNCPASLAVGASCVVAARFMPSLPGAISGVLTITDSAADSPHLVNFSGTGLTALSLAPASIAFGGVVVGTSSVARIVTLTNNQNSPLSFSFAASGNFAAVGNGATPCTASLAAQSSCTLAITFNPSTPGLLFGTLTVTHLGGFSPQVVGLSGIGAGGTAPPLAISPASLVFTNTLLGTTTTPRTVTVTNTRNTALNITGFTSSGNFSAVGGAVPCGGTLAAGANCTLNVSFSPSNAGITLGSVAFTTSASTHAQTLNLTGVGVFPLSFAPATLSFAAQTVATSSPPQTLILVNNLNAVLNLTSIVASGAFSAIPAGIRPCGSSIAARSNCTLNVSFTPGTVGMVRGAITVTHGAGNSPQSFAVSGTGQ